MSFEFVDIEVSRAYVAAEYARYYAALRREQAREERRREIAAAWLFRQTRPRRNAVPSTPFPVTACSICCEGVPVLPVGCASCRQLIGCCACVARWFEASIDSTCPLCRAPWPREPIVFTITFERHQ
uniref:RING-type domain-containing protein n=1 Tax=Steinernema glaseri TaxID=37863 RepID=A0A1I8AS24_9BILA